MPVRNLVNTTTSEVVLIDFRGVVLEAGETIDGLAFGEQVLRDSAAVVAKLVDGSIKLNDGINDFFGLAAVDVLRGTASQVTRDGKQITTVSDRPKDHYRCFIGRGDDIANNLIGLGPDLVIGVPAADHVGSIECHFVDNVYIRDGSVVYMDAPFDTTLCCDVLCPAGAPFPHPTHQGNTDLVDGSFVPNTNGTGEYMVVGTEVVLFRFINNLHLMGTSMQDVDSPEPFLLFKPYFLRFTVRTPIEIQEKDTNVSINLGLYRKRTV